MEQVCEPETKLMEVEKRLLQRLIDDFHLSLSEVARIISGLGWFKETYKYYLTLWDEAKKTHSKEVSSAAEAIFNQVSYNLSRNSLSCFSNSNFFGKIRFMLHACRKYGVTGELREKYLGWVLDFPRTEERELQALFENDLFPANLPHVYMHMAAGFIRQRLSLRLTARQIAGQYRTFQKELKSGVAHNAWFTKRLPGSYGSRQ